MLSPDKIDEIKSQCFIGAPSKIENVGYVYPKTIKEILTMGIIEYNRKLNLLLLTEIDIQKILKEKAEQEIPLEDIHVLEYLIQSANYNESFLLDLQDSFTTFLQEEILLLPELNAIVIGDPKERRLITEKNFGDFQDILRIQNKKTVKEAPPENETYGQRKMRLLREKVAEAKKKQANKNGETTAFADMLEIATVFGIDINNCTLYAFYSLLRRYQAKEKWQQDFQMICAGADSKNMKTKYWGESLDDE